MAEEKRYYWLKFQHDFFSSKRIKKLRSLAGGDTFTIIYLKMQLSAIKTNGIIEYTGLENSFAEEIALDIDEKPENVGVTINYLLSCGLMEKLDDTHVLMPYVVDNTGCETAVAQRVREYRERQKSLQCNTDVTEVKQLCNNSVTESKSKNKSKSKREIESNTSPAEPPKKTYGEYQKVKLTDEQKEKLISEFGEEKTMEAIDFLDAYIKEKKYKSYDHYLCIRRWVFQAVEDQKKKAQKNESAQMDAVYKYMREKYGNDI